MPIGDGKLVYAIKKSINGNRYYYAAISVRAGERVVLKTLRFLGKEDELTKEQADKLASKIPESEIEQAKKEVKGSLGTTKQKKPKKERKQQAKSVERAKPLSEAKRKEILNTIIRKKATMDELKRIFN